MKKLGINFIEMANPEWFEINPNLAWGFYGHRLHLYKSTQPHDGYYKLLQMGNSMKYCKFLFF